MNVLILTPDAVGSTLLQRLITVYMQFHEFDRPVINLHELTNGLVKYHNPTFDQPVLGKQDGKWGYHQSLQEICDLLSSVDHYKTSRLAHYHIRNRQDNLPDQLSFYQYLNENFYIISCRRHNLFEHALSWSLSKITKKLNVYNSSEKLNSFFDIYKDGIDLDPNSVIQTLNAYKEYLTWVNNHFNVANYFVYEEHVPCIEKYILSLPIFASQPQRLTWKDNFDIDFDQWNMCHYASSDIGALALDYPRELEKLCNDARILKMSQSESVLMANYNNIRDKTWPQLQSWQDYQALPEHIRREVEQNHGAVTQQNTDLVEYRELPRPLIEYLPASHQEFVKQHSVNYDNANRHIQNLVLQGVMISNPPIKKQILAEKKHMIRNYTRLLDVFNQWIELNPELGCPITADTLDKFAHLERQQWLPSTTAVTKSQ